MPREPRLVEPNRPHHVVLRGNNRRRLFSYVTDYLRLIAFLAVALAQAKGRCLLHGVVLMSNHIHLLLTPADEEALADFVKSVAQRYAQYRNRKRDGTGKLFEQRFSSKPMKDDNHFGFTLAYIDDNARRAGIARHPADYRWSSYHVYADTGRDEWREALADIITPADWYLDLGKTDAERKARYADWVEECHERSLRPAHADEIDRLEQVSVPYGRRLLRPDGSSAA